VQQEHGLLHHRRTGAHHQAGLRRLPLRHGRALAQCGAYISEIFRAGIQSIERGQSYAAASLGMNYGLTMRYVVLPQAFRRMLPPLGNEAITLLKDSSLVSAIGLAELAYARVPWRAPMPATGSRISPSPSCISP
jgi:polar amino acid transport system permease protein